jgi:hypothetical protein
MRSGLLSALPSQRNASSGREGRGRRPTERDAGARFHVRLKRAGTADRATRRRRRERLRAMVESGQQTQTSAATHQAALGRRRAALVAVAALLALAVLRTLLVVAPTPMRGYANNYDFVRVSGWFDLWALAPASEPEFDPRAGHHRAPLRCYRIDPSITTHIRYQTKPSSVVG